MTARKKPARSKGWRRVEGDPVVMGPLLREFGSLSDETEPLECWSHFDRQSRPRRIHARYADGWRVTLVLHVAGGGSLSQALTLKFKSKPKIASA